MWLIFQLIDPAGSLVVFRLLRRGADREDQHRGGRRVHLRVGTADRNGQHAATVRRDRRDVDPNADLRGVGVVVEPHGGGREVVAGFGHQHVSRTVGLVVGGQRFGVDRECGRRTAFVVAAPVDPHLVVDRCGIGRQGDLLQAVFRDQHFRADVVSDLFVVGAPGQAGCRRQRER